MGKNEYVGLWLVGIFSFILFFKSSDYRWLKCETLCYNQLQLFVIKKKNDITRIEVPFFNV